MATKLMVALPARFVKAPKMYISESVPAGFGSGGLKDCMKDPQKSIPLTRIGADIISGAHHAMFVAFLRSFELAPPGAITAARNIGELFVHSTGNIFVSAIQMAAPIMAINFIVTLTFAVLGKAAPGINVFSESFAVRIFAGLTLLGLTLGLTAQLVLSQLRQSPELMLRLIP